jgi:uncharacterized alkaline shock family protein YloU
MKIFSNLVFFFYTLIFLIIGACLVTVSIHAVSAESMVITLQYIYNTPQARIVTAATGLFLIIVSITFAHLTASGIQREKTIAFTNPEGRVTVSLAAIEDFIRRLITQISEIKELKPNVIASKKGVEVSTRVVLFSDTNIPEVTEKIQTVIKKRVQEMLGIEDTIKVLVHVAKIIQKEGLISAKEEKEAPFSGKLDYSKQ